MSAPRSTGQKPRSSGAPKSASAVTPPRKTTNGASAPTLKNYINRRRARIRYSGIADASTASKQVANELAGDVAFVEARAATSADKILYQLPIPTVAFDGTITVTDVEEGDTWTVEISA